MAHTRQRLNVLVQLENLQVCWCYYKYYYIKLVVHTRQRLNVLVQLENVQVGWRQIMRTPCQPLSDLSVMPWPLARIPEF